MSDKPALGEALFLDASTDGENSSAVDDSGAIGNATIGLDEPGLGEGKFHNRLGRILAAMAAFRDGDFSVRLPIEWDGTWST